MMLPTVWGASHPWCAHLTEEDNHVAVRGQGRAGHRRSFGYRRCGRPKTCRRGSLRGSAGSQRRRRRVGGEGPRGHRRRGGRQRGTGGRRRRCCRTRRRAVRPTRRRIHVAGIARIGTIVDGPTSDWDATIDVVLKGTYLVTRHAARAIRDGGRGGAIVNVSSLNAHVPLYGAARTRQPRRASRVSPRTRRWNSEPTESASTPSCRDSSIRR